MLGYRARDDDYYYYYYGPGYLSRDSDLLLWTRHSGDRIPVEAKFSTPVQNNPGTHPASYTMGTRSFPGVKQLNEERLILKI
jgi:hypothetical protein